ncbi:MAG: TerB family tellurite resistance protein [Pseudomonadota bacterium]
MQRMIDRILSLLNGGRSAPQEDSEQAGRTAIAAILVEAANADGVYLDAEQTMIDRILAERFGLSNDAAQELRIDGETAQAEAVDLVGFTRAVKDAVPFEERIEVIEAVWRVVYADGERDMDEGALIRKLSGLLYVPDRDAGLARQRVLGGK